MKSRLLASLLFVVTALFASASANAIPATGQGSCSDGGACNNSTITTLADTAVGSEVISDPDDGDVLVIRRDWFAFSVDNLHALTNTQFGVLQRNPHFKGASIEIFQPLGFSNNGVGTFELYALGAPADATNVFAASILLGSKSVSDINSAAGGFVTIDLNSTALDALWAASAAANANATFSFLFAGAIVDDNANDALLPSGTVFDYADSAPITAAKLNLTVPEPGSLALVAFALAGLAGSLRRKSA